MLTLLIVAYNVLLELGISLLQKKRAQPKMLRIPLSIVSIVSDQIKSTMNRLVIVLLGT